MIKYLLLLFTAVLLTGCGDEPEIKKVLPDDPLPSFMFVGMHQGRPAVYKYSASSDSSFVFWKNGSEKVVELSYSEDRRYAYFITARNFGKQGLFPFIKDVKLYIVDSLSGDASFIAALGSGMQISAKWENLSSFRLTLNKFDPDNAVIVEQESKIYNTSGKLLQSESRMFDLTVEGFPAAPVKKIDAQAADGKQVLHSDKMLYLINSGKDTLFSAADNFKLNNVKWLDSSRYVVINTLEVSPENNTLYDKSPKTSAVYIYDTAGNAMLYSDSGSGYRSSLIISHYLYHDAGFGSGSSIKIVNVRTGRLIKEIKIPGGCGIMNIPQIPNYDA